MSSSTIKLRVHNPTRIGFWFGSILLALVVSLPSPGKADESILTRIEAERAVYFWTPNLPALVDAIVEVTEVDKLTESLATATEPPRLNEKGVKERAEERDAGETRPSPLESFRDFLDQTDLFQDEAVLIVGLSDQGMCSSVSLIAKTDGDEQDVREVFRQLQQRIDNDGDSTDKSISESLQIENGWLCWSTDKSRPSALIQQLSTDQASEGAIAKDRTFARIFGSIDIQQDKPRLSVFVPATALPFVGPLFLDESARFSRYDTAAWRQLKWTPFFGPRNKIENGVSIGKTLAVVQPSYQGTRQWHGSVVRSALSLKRRSP